MIVPLFARKYLFSRNSRSVVNIVAGVSLVAVAVPVAAMIVLLSVFNGFESVIGRMRSACDADLTVMPARGAVFAVAQIEKERVRAAAAEVEALSYTLEQGVLMSYEGHRTAARLRGADEDYSLAVPVAGHMVSGEFELQRGEDMDFIVPGLGLARRMGVRTFITDDVTLYALNRRSFSPLLPVEGVSSQRLPVSAVFAIDADTDEGLAYTSLRAAQRLLELEGKASALNIKLRSGSDAQSVARRVAAVAGDDFRVLTREELNASVYRLVHYEKWGVFIIAVLVLVVASLSIVGVLAMLVIEKRRDIETLRTLGADRRLIRAVFVAEGVVICSLGGVAGVAAGVAAVLAQQYFSIITIPAQTLLIEAYPVELHWSDVALTAAAFALTAWVLSQITVRSMLKRQS